jgi:hypothetical protein
MKKGRQDEIQFTTKFGGKTSLGPNYFALTKISFPVTHLTPYYVKTGSSHRVVTTRLYE